MSADHRWNISHVTRRRLALRLLRESLAALNFRFGLFFLGTVAMALITLLPPQLFLYFTEGARTLETLRADHFLRQLLIFGSVIAICLFVAAFADSLLREWLRLHAEAELRRKIMRRIHQVPLATLDEMQRGDWISRISTDLDHVELFFTDELPKQIRQGAILLGCGIYFATKSGTWTLLPLLGVALLAFTHLRIQKKLTPWMAELRHLHGGVFQFLLESFEGLRTIRSHSVEPFIERRLENKLNEITRKSLRVMRYLGAVMGGTELTGQLLATVSLTAVAWALAKGQLTVEQVLVYPFFLGLFYGAAQSLTASIYQWNRFFIEGGRLGEILFDTRIAAPLQPSLSWKNECEELVVDQLEFGRDGKSLSEPLGFSFARGELWAILGPSGGGKSTLLEVLAGLRPAISGRMSLTSGVKRIWEAPPEYLEFPRAVCSYVEQQPYLFEGSLRENLVFGNPERLSDMQLWQILEQMNLAHVIQRRGGLDFELNDRGGNLSEGERYRVAICRALLLDRPFLLLDEPFAALDSVSLEKVIVALEREKERRGIILVTHYLPEALSAEGVLDLGKLNCRPFKKDRHIGGQGVFVSPQDEPVLFGDLP